MRKMRRVVLEVVVPDDEFETDVHVLRDVDSGVMEAMWGSQRDVRMLRPGDVCDFTDEEWQQMKAVSK